MKLVVTNLKLYESLERDFPALGRVSSATFNAWAEKEQLRSVLKVPERGGLDPPLWKNPLSAAA